MSIQATEQVTNTAQSPMAATAKSSGDDKQMFLELMVAQLRYQDPLNPADSGEFLSQTAQFNALEQMTKVAEQTASMVATQLAFGAAGLVGKEVTFNRADGTTASGLVEGVTFGSEGPMLEINGESVPLALLQTVGKPPAVPDPDPDAPDATDPA